jgi:HlyD family secretion protein
MSASPISQWLEPPPQLPAPPPKPSARWPLYAVTALALLGAAAYFRPRSAQTIAPAASVATVRATRGTLHETLRVAGSVSAGHFANIAAPVLQAPDTGRGLTLVFLVPSGSHVKQGQVLAEFDSQDIKDHLDDVEANITQAQLDITRRKAQLAAQMESLRQGLRVNKATLDRATQDARAVPVANPINQEVLKLAVEEYREAYEEAVKQLPLTEERQLADLKLYELSYAYELRHRERHLRDLARCTVRAPMNGMVVMQSVYRGGEMNQIQVGDQMFPGQPFMSVVDPASMQLDATMSQSETEQIRLGQHGTVRFDAFPDIVLQARVQSVGALAIGGRRLNYYVRRVPVRLTIETQDPRVIPDLSASADVATGPPSSGILVPREALFQDGGQTVVYIKQGETFVTRKVELGGENSTQAAVTGGLEEGQEIALQPAVAALVH